MSQQTLHSADSTEESMEQEIRSAQKHFAEVLLPLPLADSYTYEVPAELAPALNKGMMVEVQFGRQKIYTALVLSLNNRQPEGYKPKPILGLLGPEVVVTETQLKFWDWLAQYYLCTKGEIMNAALPAPYRLNSETKVLIREDFDDDFTSLNDSEYLIAEALTIQNELSLKEIQAILKKKRVQHIIRGLIEKEVAVLREEMKPTYKVKTRKMVGLNSNLQEDEAALRTTFDQLERAPKQLELLMRWHELTRESESGSFDGNVDKEQSGGAQNGMVIKALLLKLAGASNASYNALIKKEIFVEQEEAISRLESPDNDNLMPVPVLTPHQEEAFEQLKTQLEQQQTVLMHGITSSGKTALYMQLIEALPAGKQVLFLLPEIALTAQIVQRFQSVFGDEVGVYHSRFNQSERVEIWKEVEKGNYRIIIGPRSALFLPFKSLGLLIVDEEHDTSYKQFDPAPRYQARDASIYLAALYGAKTILGTATPSLETYQNSLAGKYGKVVLTERFGGIAPPEIELVNMKEQRHKKLLKGNFSDRLIDSIGEVLSQGKQTILFRNRRGYAPLLNCEDCGWVPQCDNCDVSLTYHRHYEQLRCHLCGFHRQPPASCPACKGKRLTYEGYGTEKVESELQLYFPDARIGRMDFDTVKGKTGHQKIINSFENQELDILVGTQMVTKGLDFSNVSLVGILSADQLIYYPDFRAHERAFQLIEQVSGRAGRKGGRGKVLIQATDINHPILQLVLNGQAEQFYQSELGQRRKWDYPPYVRLIRLTLKHRYADTARGAASIMAGWLRDALGSRVLGPAQPGIARVRNQYIWEILIKLEKDTKQLRIARNAIRNAKEKLFQRKPYRSVTVIPNMDPY